MRHLIFAMSLLAVVSCKDNKKETIKKETDTVEHPKESHEDHHNDEASNVYDNAWTKQIAMNDGGKWQSDVQTNEGVAKMKNTLESQTTNTLDDYHKLAEKLNDDKNNVVNNCTMQGAPHDNLHVWLLPLMEKIAALSGTKTVEDAAKIKHSITENINGYDTYFK